MDQLRRTAAPRPAPDSLAVPAHLASSLRAFLPGVTWLRLDSLQDIGLDGVNAFGPDGALPHTDESRLAHALVWITGDKPDADWAADLGLNLQTGLLRPWRYVDFTAATSAEVG